MLPRLPSRGARSAPRRSRWIAQPVLGLGEESLSLLAMTRFESRFPGEGCRNVRARKRLCLGTEVEADMRRLVVGAVLPRHGQPVNRIVHQGVAAMLGRDRRGEDAELLVVGGPENHFLAPVAEDVG